MTSSYSTNDVSRLAHEFQRTASVIMLAGLVGQTETPAVPQQRRYSFDFRDVMVLRMANELLERESPLPGFSACFAQYGEQLPESLPLSVFASLPSMIVSSSAHKVVPGSPESSQFILSFELATDEQIALELPDEVRNEEDNRVSASPTFRRTTLSVRLRPGFRSVSQSKKMSLRRHLMPIFMPSLRIRSTARPT